MSGWAVWFSGLGAMVMLGFFSWLLSLRLKDVSIVDSVWSLFFLLGALVYALIQSSSSTISIIMLILVALWAIRLSLYLTWRNWGESEDRRYRAMRERHGERFALRSLFTVFTLQAVLAWFISLPLLAVITASDTPGILTWVGVALTMFGILFESLADSQLARFKARPENQGQVLHSGLWRYSRHPNYFGECMVWWGYYIIALSVGGWWSLPAPLLMTLLLLRVSGVSLLEKDISERRPAYRQYVETTSAFIPLPPTQELALKKAGHK